MGNETKTQESRIGIPDVMLFTTGMAIALSIQSRWSHIPLSVIPVIHIGFIGLAMGLSFIVARHLWIDWDRNRLQPGVWLVVMTGFWSLLMVTATVVYFLSGDVGRSMGSDDVTSKIVVALYALAYLSSAIVAFVSMRWLENRWRVLFVALGVSSATWALMQLNIVLAYELPGFGAYRFWQILILSLPVFVLGSFVWCMVVDMRKKVPFSGLHWLGVFVFLLQWVAIPVATNILTRVLSSKQLFGI